MQEGERGEAISKNEWNGEKDREIGGEKMECSGERHRRQ